MKKSFGLLTACLFTTLLYADPTGSHSRDDSEGMEPAPPPCGNYYAHEWDLSIWGTYNRDGGGGAKLEYFWSKYFGLGVEGFVLNGPEIGGAVLASLTVRSPIGCSHFAPYAFVGGGATTDDVRAMGQIGGGLEFRFTRHVSVMADFAWNIVGENTSDFGMARAGINFAF